MKNIYFMLLYFVLFCSINIKAQDQVLMSELWTNTTGSPSSINLSVWDEIEWSSSVLTSDGELIVVGNTLINPGNTDIIITRFDRDGSKLWEQTYAGNTNSYDYGLAVTIDNDENILVAGVVSSPNQTTDIAILKYSPTGEFNWAQIIDGGFNQFDFPTAITSDGDGKLYVVGNVLNPISQTDWIMMELNSSGEIQWTSFYNYANLHEIPTTIKIENASELVVSGFSNSTVNSWDFAKVVFSKNNGTILSKSRENIPNLTLLDAPYVASDGDNIYIAGTTEGTFTGNKDIQLVKINNNFQIEWIQTLDLAGLEDRAKTLEIDKDGNIVLIGNSKNADNKTEITFAKYAPNGDLLFNTEFASPVGGHAEGVRVRTTEAGTYVITGSVDRESSRDMVTLVYDKDGNRKATKYYEGDNNTQDEARSLEISDNGDILVVGKSNGIQSSYSTVKYETLNRSDEAIIIDDKPSHKKNEFIVRFAPDHVNTAFVNDTRLLFGTVDDVLTPEAANFLKSAIDLEGVSFVKVHPKLTTRHTTSTTRLGETIPIPKFWSSFAVVYNDVSNLESKISEFEAFTGIVIYAEPIAFLSNTGQPNDASYFDQESLTGIAYPNSDINIEDAWDLETGDHEVIVGIIEVGSFYLDADELGANEFESSQFIGGYDYGLGQEILDVDIESVTDDHPVAVTAVLGARRDNVTGIAGVAGGGTSESGFFNEGVSLVGMGGVTDSESFQKAFCESITDCEAPSIYGYGVNLLNLSLKFNFVSTEYPEIERLIKYAWRNNCIISAGLGNDGFDHSIVCSSYPSCYNDEWLISVSASGTDGAYANGINGTFEGGADFGGNVDLVAPGVSELIYTLSAGGPYLEVSGTSFSTPLVSGVAALMYSKHNTNNGLDNNLAIEDVEFILQKYATDSATWSAHTFTTMVLYLDILEERQRNAS